MDLLPVAKEIRTAIKQGDAEKVKELIADNKDLLNLLTPFGTWVHVASSRGKLDIVILLIDMGIDINISAGMFGGTAINEAANEGNLEIVDYLLSCGAKLDTSEPEKNPLFSAILSGNKDIVQLLLNNGIDASVRYTGEYMKDMDAYDFAIERGQKEIAEMLKPYRK